MSNFFRENRKRISEIIDERGAVVLFAGRAPVKRGDEKYPFSPDRNFYYFTGLDGQNLIYMAYKTDGEFSEYLFLERRDPILAKWMGEVIGEEEAQADMEEGQVKAEG